MGEFRLHPYITATAAIVVMLAVVFIVVEKRTAAPIGRTDAFSTGELTPLTPVGNASIDPAIPPAMTIGSTTTPPFIPFRSSAESGAAPAPFDMAAFLAMLSQPPKPRAEGNARIDLSSSYAYIPQGLISATTSSNRTPQQQALYDYGNEAGSYVETYDDTHRDAPAIMKTQMEDRQNTEKAQAVKAIGIALYQTGKSLEGIEQVPDTVKTAHLALAKAYEDIGTKLQAVPDAPRDPDLVTAIETYDAAVDTFNKKYIALATILSLAGVKFQPQDPGAVFQFSAGGGL